MQKKLVLFDFDGVLVNTIDFWFSINQKYNPHLTREDYSQMSHGNFFESFEGEEPKVKFTPHPDYHEDYHQGIRNFNTPEKLKAAVKVLAEEFRLAIASSGTERSIAHLLENEGLLDFFPDILGYETHKNKTIKIKSLLEKYSVLPEHTVFITDTLGDILEGHGANVQSIGVVWGMHDRETLQKGNPAVIIDNPADLIPAIEKILK